MRVNEPITNHEIEVPGGERDIVIAEALHRF